LSRSASRIPAVAVAAADTAAGGAGCMRRSGGDEDCGLAIRSRNRWGKCG
jgi:hypothetical protein